MEVIETGFFIKKLTGLKNKTGALHIAKRLHRLSLGLLGDFKEVGERVIELRIDFGQGFRAYVTNYEGRWFTLTCGEKRTQTRDIKKAIEMSKELRNDEEKFFKQYKVERV